MRSANGVSLLQEFQKRTVFLDYCMVSTYFFEDERSEDVNTVVP